MTPTVDAAPPRLGPRVETRRLGRWTIHAIQAGGQKLDGGAMFDVGVRPEDIALVINSHLHFDHAGGNMVRETDGRLRPAFVNARYVVQRGEYEFATHTNERTAGSYFAHNFVPLAEANRFDFIE